MILPFSLTLSFYYWHRAGRIRRRDWRHFLESVGRPEMLKCFLLLTASMVMLVATIFSFSRMGLISMLASLGVMAAIAVKGRRRNLAPLPTALIVVLLAGGIATAGWVGISPVIQRFGRLPQNEPLESGSDGRVALWKDAIPLVYTHPLAGIGLGCFEYAFTRVQTIRLTYAADHAHNDYLELAVELGLPCTVALFAVIFWLIGQAARASMLARASLTRCVALGSFGGSTALLVHSLADFNLYIPANALMFSTILAFGYAMSLDLKADRAREIIESKRDVLTSQESLRIPRNARYRMRWSA